jgi:hypothetical protein
MYCGIGTRIAALRFVEGVVTGVIVTEGVEGTDEPKRDAQGIEAAGTNVILYGVDIEE